MSPPAATGGTRDGHANSGLGEPLLRNGGGGRVHAGAVVTVANGVAEPAAEKKRSAEDRYWVDIDQPEALEPADVESGRGGRRPLLFRNKKVKRSILYPYRCVYTAARTFGFTLLQYRGFRVFLTFNCLEFNFYSFPGNYCEIGLFFRIKRSATVSRINPMVNILFILFTV